MIFSATKVDGGYLLNETKMWITNSYESQARVCFEFTEFLPKEVFHLGEIQ